MSKIKDKRKGKTTLRERAVPRKKNTVTLEDAFRLFLNIKQANNLKDRTLKDYEIHLNYFGEWVSECYGGLSINEIDVNILREYIVWSANEKGYYEGHPLKEESNKGRKGLSPSSVNVRIRVLRTFFSTLFKEEIINRNPAENLSLMKAEQDTVQPLTEDELRRLLKAPDQRYYAQFRDYVILMLMLDTGMRLNEICSLEVKDINLTSRQIILPAIKNKNRKGRVLPLSNKTANLLTQLINETKQNFDTDFVFVTYYGEPVNEKTVQKALPKYAEKAGITKRVTPHVIRHCFAKFASMNGMDIFSLMRILGHADISTTRKYVQINDEDVKKQHDRFSPITRVLFRK